MEPTFRAGRGQAAAVKCPRRARWWAYGCLVSALLWYFVCSVDGSPAVSPWSPHVLLNELQAVGGSSSPLGRVGLPREDEAEELKSVIQTEPSHPIANARRVAVSPGRAEPILGSSLQPIRAVSWKNHPSQPGVRSVQWVKAIIRTAHLDTGSRTNNFTVHLMRDIGARNWRGGPDQTGHLVARRLGGVGIRSWSVFPQLQTINGGSFSTFEAGAYAKVQRYGKIAYFVKMRYNSPSVQWPLRPMSYRAAYCWKQGRRLKWYGEWFRNQ